jgi:hypothetical protein
MKHLSSGQKKLGALVVLAVLPPQGNTNSNTLKEAHPFCVAPTPKVAPLSLMELWFRGDISTLTSQRMLTRSAKSSATLNRIGLITRQAIIKVT